MSKYLLLLFSLSLLAEELPIATVQTHLFAKPIALNAKIVQLQDNKQAIMTQISGHLENYFVTPNQAIQAGDKIALLRSTELSELTASFLAIKKQLVSLSKNFHANKKLFAKGLISAQELNRQSIQQEAQRAKLNRLTSTLETLGIDTKNLKKTSSDYIVRAHSSGIVSKILQPLHAMVNQEEELISIVKKQGFYLKSYLPLKYAQKVHIGDTLTINIANQPITTHITQILPTIDEKSQRVVLLSPIMIEKKRLFIGAFVPATLYVGEKKSYLSVQKSALSFFDNEWVVFVPSADEKMPFAVKVVKIIDEDVSYVAIEGLKEGEKYVADKSYYVKSQLLKSSLGDGD